LTFPVKGQNIIARAVSIFGGSPPDLPGQVRAVGLRELAPLKINNKSLPGFAKRTVAVVPFNWINFLNKPTQTFRNRLGGYCKSWRSDKDFGEQPCGILCRDLCRNPPIPARIGRCRVLSLGYR